MTCGIYQIVNQVNGKSYIGQSRNIEKRWRKHKSGLNRETALQQGSYPLRSAFLKYGLIKFKFEIIEECSENDLLIREQYWIDKINPEYNCNIWTPARKKKSVDKIEPKFWIQYHNCDKLGYIPAESIFDDSNNLDVDIDDAFSSISTDKRAILSAKGDTVFLIAGIGKNPKQYYLMYRFIIEEVETISEESETNLQGEMIYSAFGNGWVVNPPQLLNSEDFNVFKKYCGNFGFGFMSASKSDYLKTLVRLSEKYRTQTVKFSEYIEQFYTNVLATNPKELSVRDKRGVARHLALSLYPDDSIFLLTGEHTKFVTFGMTEFGVKYRDRLLIHTLSFYEDVSPEFTTKLKQGSLELLGQIGLDEENFPAHALQGWVNVDNIYKYDQDSFAADKEAHGWGDDLDAYRRQCGFSECDAWCIEISNPVILEKPILLYEPEDTGDGDFWFPNSEKEIQAFRLALEYVAS
ncbi:MAG: hypothetical protein DCF19_13060 [Pseudanabaena frigida]|uniref:GIY-YIG domain-containing protein n=1 Tax=Pseudanabaena frigida TaxID=945775 RepID=A0A2W4W984_9CYAN|nr:MAG: hypothetical protein DCF19_13060 [Pseudanabaena frigida]